jgi:hypothetical protein
MEILVSKFWLEITMDILYQISQIKYKYDLKKTDKEQINGRYG